MAHMNLRVCDRGVCGLGVGLVSHGAAGFFAPQTAHPQRERRPQEADRQVEELTKKRGFVLCVYVPVAGTFIAV